MACLKCGKETTQNQVFCDHCLDTMAAFPVKPGTPVNLPMQKISDMPKKGAARRRLSQEELLSLMKKVNLGLLIAVAVLIIALSLTITALLRTTEALHLAQNTGKNFTVETTPDK